MTTDSAPVPIEEAVGSPDPLMHMGAITGGPSVADDLRDLSRRVGDLLLGHMALPAASTMWSAFRDHLECRAANIDAMHRIASLDATLAAQSVLLREAANLIGIFNFGQPAGKLEADAQALLAAASSHSEELERVRGERDHAREMFNKNMTAFGHAMDRAEATETPADDPWCYDMEKAPKDKRLDVWSGLHRRRRADAVWHEYANGTYAWSTYDAEWGYEPVVNPIAWMVPVDAAPPSLRPPATGEVTR